MIARTQDIQFGVAAQTLILDCEDGRPASVTSVTVYPASADDTSSPELATTGSASVETNPSTTLFSAAAVGDESVSVTSATGITVGRDYLLTSTTGVLEWISVRYVSGTTVGIKSPLMNAHASGSTLKSTRCTIVVDTTWAADQSNVSPTWSPNPSYRVRWLVVDSAGASQVYDRYFDLVRYPARHGVTPPMVEARFPGWLDALPIDARKDQGRELIERAFAQVRFDLYADNKADQAVRNAEMVTELVIARAPLLAVEDAALAGGTVDGARYEVASKVYRQRYDQFIRAPVAPLDPSGGGAAVVNRPEQLWKR